MPKTTRTKPAPKAEESEVVVQERPTLTVNGKPIPPEFETAIPYSLTDQGIAERNARPEVREDAGRAKVTRSEFDKSLERMEFDDSYFDSDPFKEAIAEHGRPGFVNKMLSDRVVTRRGMRGWQPVRKENGDPVRVAGMVLAEMPVSVAAKRNAKYQEAGNEALRDAADAYAEEQEKVIRESGRDGLGVLRPGETLTDSRDPDRAAVSGLHATRGLGNQGA